MMVQAAFCTGLEAAINQYLRLDPDTAAALRRLSGKVVALHIRQPDVYIYFLPLAQGLRVQSRFGGEADVTISGDLFSLLRAGVTQNQQDLLLGGMIDMQGDTETGRRFQRVLQGVEIDWEEHLSHLVGDIAAHQVGNLARGAGRWLSETAATLGQDAGEYLREERGLLPWPDEVNELLTAIDTLRDDSERLAQRVRRLQQRIARESA